MRRPFAATEDQLFSAGCAVTGLTLAAGAALAADLARDHMMLLGEICGAAASHPHCGWCYAAAGLASAGLAAFAVALRPAGLREVKAELSHH